MCGGNKNTTTQQSTSTTAPPGYIQNALQGILGQAQGVSQTPYNPATQQQVAGLTGQQQQAFQDVSNTQGIANPYISQATALANQSGAPISADQISNYSNPYQQQVINSTMAEMNQNNAMQQQQVTGNAAIQGALGGDRTAVAQSTLAGQQALSNNATLAGLNSQNYTQALGAAQADRNAAGQASYQMGNLGNEAQQSAYTDINQLAQAGNAQQQQQQNVYNAGSANAQAQSQYPFQTTQWLSGILGGLGGLAGGTTNSNGTTTTPNANPFSQALGLGLAATKFFADGGTVGGLGTPRRYDDGGGVDFGDPNDVAPASSSDSSGDKYMFSDKQSDALAKLGAQIATPTPQKPVQMLQANPYHASGSGGGMSAPVPYSRPAFADGGDTTYLDVPPMYDAGSLDRQFAGNAANAGASDNAVVVPVSSPTPEPLSKDVAAPSPGLSGIAGLTASAANPGLAASPTPAPNAAPSVDTAPAASAPAPDVASAPTPDNSNLPRGLRNNNPGNIEYGPFAKAQGATGSDGRFAIFPNAEAGQAAMGKLLQGYQNNHGLNTVEGIVSRWAPPGENNVSNYAGFVSKALGVGPNDPINVNDPDTNAKLRQAITAYENGTKTGLSGSTASAMNPSLAPSQAAAQPDKSVSHSGLFGNPFGLSDNARDALSTAGFAMMASRSPNFGNAIGEGGLAGLQAYQQNKTLDQKAKQLSEQSEMHKAQLANMSASTENTKQRLALDMSKPVLLGSTTDPYGVSKNVYGVPDPKNPGKYLPVQSPNLQGQTASAPQVGPDGQKLTGEAALANKPPTIAERARNIIAGNETLPTSNRSDPTALAVQAAVREADPTYNANRFNYLKSWEDPNKAVGKTRIANNTAISHAGHLSDLIPNMPDHSLNIMNRASNWWHGEENDPTLAEWKANAQPLADEITKVMTGTAGTLEDRQAVLKTLDPSQGKDALNATLKKYTELFAGKTDALVSDWKRNMGPAAKAPEVLDDENAATLEKLKSRYLGDQKPAAAAQGNPQNPTVPNPFQPGTAAAPPVQGAKQAPDGNWYLPDPQRPGKYLKVG